jgi:hypothetical protein
VILVGTRSPWLRSMATRGDLRDQPEAELEDLEPIPPPRTVPFSPRPAAPAQEPDQNGDRSADRAPEVTDLNKAAERNRRAAE